MACTGVGAAAGGGGSWGRSTLLLAVVNGEVLLFKGRIVSKGAHKVFEAVHLVEWRVRKACKASLGEELRDLAVSVILYR